MLETSQAAQPPLPPVAMNQVDDPLLLPKVRRESLQAEFLSDLSYPHHQNPEDRETQYLVENATGKGAKGKWMLDSFTGSTLSEFKTAIKEICHLSRVNLELEIEAYDPIMKEYVLVGEGLRGLARCAVVRVIRAN